MAEWFHMGERIGTEPKYAYIVTEISSFQFSLIKWPFHGFPTGFPRWGL